jgi:uncharacterized membrane protein YfcA
MYVSVLSGVPIWLTSVDALEKGLQEERTRVKRWLILLFAAVLVVLSGVVAHQGYLEALGLVIAVLAIVLLLWSFVQFSLEVRPPTTTRRRFRRVPIPHIRRRNQGRGYTEELHAAIFQDPTTDPTTE